jgi:ATP-binding protein involved in chromosome partitioning
MPSQASLDAALDAVLDPVFEKPMRAIGSLLEAHLEGDKASLRIKLPSPSPTIEAKARRRLEEACQSVGVREVAIAIDVEVPTREVMGDDPIPGVRNVILVMSGKGGVGKSTDGRQPHARARQARRARRSARRRHLRPLVPTMIGVSGPPRLADGKIISPLERFGVRIMSIGFLLDDDEDRRRVARTDAARCPATVLART